MTSQPDSDSTFPVPDNDNTSEERTEEFPASDQHDSEATIVGPNAAPETGSGATIDDGRTGPLGADPEMTLEQKIGDILEKFAENLVPEHQDLDQTLPHTSLKPVQIESGARTASLKSFTQTQSLRPRSVQSAYTTDAGGESVSSAVSGTPGESSLDYLTLGKLGEGGMGTVHLARQVALGREVALKQIHQRSSRKQSVRDEFLTEAALTGKLEHPNIVPIYEVGESAGGELFYSMKNVKGRDWDDTIDTLSLNANLEILIDVCDAIAFAHAEGVIHRDLKPQNIMIGGFGEVLVLDWGLAVLTEPGEDVKASAGGTPCYMAPEMINPPFLVGPRSDVYLLGAILFRFLTGKTPHAGTSAMSSLKAASQNEIVEPDAERMQRVDPTGELLSVAMKAMATTPADRYQTVGEFQQALRDFDAHQESLKLAVRAEEALEAAGQSGDYMQYSEAVFGFGQAVELWTGNASAAEGIERSRQAYALCAEQKEDYELGLSLLDESVPEQQALAQRLTAARDERNARQGRLKRMKQGLVVAAGVILVIVGGAAFWINNERVEANRQRKIAQTSEQNAQSALSAQLQAELDRRVSQARSLRQATPQAAAIILRELDRGSSQIQDTLHSQLSDNSLSPREINRIRLGLLSVDAEQLEPIVEFVLSASGQHLKPDELLLIRDVLSPHGTELAARFLPSLQNASNRLRAGCFLAGFAADGDFWPAHADSLAADLVRVLPSELTPYRDALRPVQEHLITPLSAIYRDDSSGEQVRSFATDTLADYLSEDAGRLFDLLADSSEQQFGTIFDKLTVHQQRAIELGNAEVSRTFPEDTAEADREALAVRQANAAVLLLRMNAADQVWPLLQHSPDPRVRSYIIHWLSPRGGDAQTIIARYEQEPDVTIKRALLLCLGEFELSDKQPLIKTLLTVYRSDPDAGLHAAAEWLLRQWEQGKRLAAIDKELQQKEDELVATRDKQRQWYINSQDQTFVILDENEFQMGSPEGESGHHNDERLHRRKIGRRIAISAKEVTREQWRVFSQANATMVLSADSDKVEGWLGSDDSPMIAMEWYEAAHYCNWLSEQEGIPEEQWCYEQNKDGEYGPGMKARENFLELTGYRLPTEAEWEYACRAGSGTSRYYGVSEVLLSRYAWYQVNGDNHTHPVASLKPNDFGLFDMQGNVYEWCYDAYVSSYPTAREEEAVKDAPPAASVEDTPQRVLRGGSFYHPSSFVRSAHRLNYHPVTRYKYFGFRPARTYHLSG